jgi:hypothetical protein
MSTTIHPFHKVKVTNAVKKSGAWSFIDSLLKALAGVFAAAMHRRNRAIPPRLNAPRPSRRKFFSAIARRK